MTVRKGSPLRRCHHLDSRRGARGGWPSPSATPKPTNNSASASASTPTIKEADDFFGSHVNLAARVGGAATGDEILVSGLLKALTESAGEFRFDAGREVDLKGISGPQRAHGVEWRT